MKLESRGQTVSLTFDTSLQQEPITSKHSYSCWSTSIGTCDPKGKNNLLLLFHQQPHDCNTWVLTTAGTLVSGVSEAWWCNAAFLGCLIAGSIFGMGDGIIKSWNSQEIFKIMEIELWRKIEHYHDQTWSNLEKRMYSIVVSNHLCGPFLIWMLPTCKVSRG